MVPVPRVDGEAVTPVPVGGTPVVRLKEREGTPEVPKEEM